LEELIQVDTDEIYLYVGSRNKLVSRVEILKMTKPGHARVRLLDKEDMELEMNVKRAFRRLMFVTGFDPFKEKQERFAVPLDCQMFLKLDTIHAEIGKEALYRCTANQCLGKCDQSTTSDKE